MRNVHLLAVSLLHFALAAAASSNLTYLTNPVPTVTQPIVVTVMGAQFVKENLVTLSSDQYCRNVSSNPSEGVVQQPGVSPVNWTMFDSPDEWVVVFPRPSIANFPSRELYVCYYSPFDNEWLTLRKPGGARPFYVHNDILSYVIWPSTPVAANWSTGLRLTIFHHTYKPTDIMVALVGHPDGCEREGWPSPLIVGYDGSPQNLSRWTDPPDPQVYKVPKPELVMEIPTLQAADEVYVCYTEQDGVSWTKIPMDLAVMSDPAPRLDTTVVDSHLPPRFPFTIFRDFREPHGDVKIEGARFACPFMIAGVETMCNVSFYSSVSDTTLPHPDTTSADFEVVDITDGNGQRLCPTPKPVLLDGPSAVGIPFRPNHPGRLGSFRLMYRGAPVPIFGHESDLVAEYHVSPTNTTHGEWWQNRRPQDPTVIKFIVDPSPLDRVTVGQELVVNGGAENGTTDGWDVLSGNWTTAKIRPVPAWGSWYFKTDSGRAEQMVSLGGVPPNTAVAVAARFYHYVDVTHRDFVMHDPLEDGSIEFLWRQGQTVLATAKVVVTHHASYRTKVGMTWTGKAGLTMWHTMPSPFWHSFSDMRVPPAGADNVLITLRADGDRGATVVFDDVTAMTMEQRTTPAAEVTALQNLYTATNGASWISKDRWLEGDPCLDHWVGISCRHAHVTHVRLAYNNLRGGVQGLFEPLGFLEEVDLRGNQLTGDLGTMPATVRRLEIDWNRFDTVNSLPQCTAVFTARKNRIREFAPLTLPYLEALDLSHNIIEAFPVLTATGNLTKLMFEHHPTAPISPLRTLNLADNMIDGPLPDLVADPGWYPHFTTLILSNNKFNGSIPTTWGGSYPALRMVSIEGNGVTGTLPHTFARVFNVSKLQLMLGNNRLTGLIPSFTKRVPRINLMGNGWGCPLPTWFTPAQLQGSLELNQQCDASWATGNFSMDVPYHTA